MTDRELMQQALDALEHGLPIIEDFGGKEQLQLQHKAIAVLYEALRARLAQPEQEPPCKTGSQCVGGKCERCAVQEWQGLTDEEMMMIYGQSHEGKKYSLGRAIEAKLKEKNHAI